MNKVKVLACVGAVVIFASIILLVIYNTGTLEYVIHPITADDLAYSEKESVEKIETSWVLNEEYIKNHLPAEVLKNTLVTTADYKAEENAYNTCYTYCMEQSDSVRIENITTISDAYAYGTYADGDKNYYVVVFNTTYEEDGTFTILRYERMIT